MVNKLITITIRIGLKTMYCNLHINNRRIRSPLKKYYIKSYIYLLDPSTCNLKQTLSIDFKTLYNFK